MVVKPQNSISGFNQFSFKFTVVIIYLVYVFQMPTGHNTHLCMETSETYRFRFPLPKIIISEGDIYKVR